MTEKQGRELICWRQENSPSIHGEFRQRFEKPAKKLEVLLDDLETLSLMLLKDSYLYSRTDYYSAVLTAEDTPFVYSYIS